MSDATNNQRDSSQQGSSDASSARVEREATEHTNQRLTLVLFGGILAVAAIGIAVSAVAMSTMGTRHHQTIAVASGSASANASVKVPSSVKLWVAPEWKMGADGEKHDAYSKTNFTVKVGQPLRMTIDNRDDTVHSITSGEAGVNIVVQPGVHTYTLLVRHTGHFKWICAYPCDPFAMDRAGYMGGYITAV